MLYLYKAQLYDELPMTIKFLAGVDEVGRGCLAGPVMSAAIILNNKIDKKILVDSKTISHKKRCKLANYIIHNSYSIGIGISTNVEIDQLNIHNATLLSMEMAILNLCIKPNLIYVDGLYKPETSIKAKCFIKGDSRFPEISAASIVAKVLRDNEMLYLNEKTIVYSFNKNKGYPTKDHKMALEKFGPSIYHRKTFNPVYQMSLS